MELLRTGLVGVDDEHRVKAADDETRAWAIDDVLDAALTTTGAEVAEIFLRTEGASGVSLAGFRGPFPEAFNQITRFEDGQGYPGLVVSYGRPLKVSDLVNDGRFLRTRVKDLGFRYFLGVPVPGRERPIGSLDVAWRRGSEALLAHCPTLSRDAERLALILDRRRIAIAPHAAEHVEEAERRLDLRFLGSFEARRGGTPLSIDCFARKRSVTVLKILATNYGKTVVRDELIELLWPSDAPKDAAELLKIAVHYLRRGLGEAQNAKTETSFISTEPNGYAFNPASPHRIDALEFEAAAQDGIRLERQGRWREALVVLRSAADLYGGDYLEDDPYSDWCLRRRRQLRETLFDVLLTTAHLLRSVGDDEAAIRCYRRILELDPCLEDVHRDLMELLCRCGKRTQALRQFEACRRALREEFDAAPVLETETLYRRILGRLTG
ncbi:MAG TPA: BTAD domain-containing putative transcriptional regulator [Candidatus Limnocylindria bacterium]|nr:BTAD domain-containing putative transcriptional regulator [Candidatus Limnocylindria bacterium]